MAVGDSRLVVPVVLVVCLVVVVGLLSGGSVALGSSVAGWSRA